MVSTSKELEKNGAKKEDSPSVFHLHNNQRRAAPAEVDVHTFVHLPLHALNHFFKRRILPTWVSSAFIQPRRDLSLSPARRTPPLPRSFSAAPPHDRKHSPLYPPPLPQRKYDTFCRQFRDRASDHRGRQRRSQASHQGIGKGGSRRRKLRATSEERRLS